MKSTFSVIENKTTQSGAKISVVVEKNGKKHILPLWLSMGVIELNYEINESLKYIFDLSSFGIKSLNENDLITVEVLRIEERISDNSLRQKVFVTDYKRFLLDVYFLDWQYCKNFKIPKYLELNIFKDRNGKVKCIQKISSENKHPHFEVGKEYKLKFLGYTSGKSENGSLKLKDEYEGIYHVNAYYNQNFNELKEHSIKCIFKGYDKYGNTVLQQSERTFLTFKNVFKKENPFSDIIKDDIKNTNEYEEFQLQYENKDNRWLLTLVKVLNNTIDRLVENKNHNNAYQVINIFLQLEEYIIASGYLTLFPHKSDDISRIAKSHIIYYRSLLKPLEKLSDLSSEDYLYSCLKKVEVNSNDLTVRESQLEQIFLTLSLSFIDYFNVEFLFKFFEDFYKILDKKVDEKYVKKYYNYIKSKIRPLELSLFRKTFFNSKSKNLFYQQNNKLISYFNVCNLLCHYVEESNINEKLIWYVRAFRCISLYNSNETKSIKIIQSLIDALTNKSKFKLAPLKYLSSLSYDHLSFLQLENRNQTTVEWEHLKSIYSKGESIESEVVGEDLFGFYVLYNDYKGYVSTEFMREYEAAFFYFNNTSQKPKFSILSVDNFSKKFLIKYQKSDSKLKQSKKLKEGSNIKGIVIEVFKSGAKILCGDIFGFVHKSEIDWGPVSFVDDYLTVGKQYEFKVVGHRISGNNYSYELSLKQTFNDPWKTMYRNLDTSFDAIFLRRIDLNYLNDFNGLNIDFERSILIQTNCPRCYNIRQLENTLHIDTIKKTWDCITLGCNFKGEEILLFRILSKRFNTSIPINELKTDERKFIEEILERGSKVKIVLQSFDLSTRHSYSTFKSLEIYGNEKIGIDYVITKEDKIIAELAKTYEELASLSSTSFEEIEFLQWAKHYYSLINDSKSYFYNVYILYLELINEMKKFSIQNNLDVVINFKNRIEQLLSNEENLTTTLEVYKELNNHYQIFKYFLLLDDTSFETNLFLLKENFNTAISNITVKNFASIILSHNLLLSHKPNNIFNLYAQTCNYLYSTLQEGKLNEINPLIEEDSFENDYEKEKRNELLKLLHEGEGRNIEFKSSLLTPIIPAETISLIQNFDQRIKQAQQLNDVEKVKQLKSEKSNRCKIATETDIKYSAIKEIAAFANTDGGCLIIGINDAKEIIGLDEDFKKMTKENKQDEFITKFDDLIKDYLGENIQQLISHKFIQIDNKIVFLLTVKPNSNKRDPILMKKNSEGKPESEFYIRAQGSVRKLSTLEIITYMNSFNLSLSSP